MTTTDASDRFTALPNDQTLAATVVALEEHGFSVEVVDDLATARNAVLAHIPQGSSVMANTSVTLQETVSRRPATGSSPRRDQCPLGLPVLRHDRAGVVSAAAAGRGAGRGAQWPGGSTDRDGGWL